MALQIRRGPNAQRATTLLQTGEVAWTTDTKKLYVGDGVTTGGVNILANIAGTGFVWNPSTEQLDLAGSTITGITADNVSETNGITPRLWYNATRGKTDAQSIFTTSAGAQHTGISFSWDDVNQKLSATVLTENAADAAASLFTNGTHTGISFTYGLTQDAADRIDAAVDPEFIQDTVASLIAAGVHTGITFTYSDNLNALSAAVTFPAPSGNLGGDLTLNSKNITGTGNINITGNITASGTLSLTAGLGADLPLNSKNITGTGNITISGGVSSTTATIGSMTLATNTITASSQSLLFNNASTYSTVVNGITDGGYVNVASLVVQGQKGTIASPTNTAPGEYVSRVQAFGYYGGTYKLMSNMVSQWASDATMTDTYPKSTLQFSINGGGTTTYYAGLTGPGVWFSNVILPGAYASSTAYPPTLPQSQGGIIFDSVTKHLVGYNGTSWRQIDSNGTTSAYAKTIASASTIAPTQRITFISGTVQIATITPPAEMTIGAAATFNATIAPGTGANTGLGVLTVTSVPTGTVTVGSEISGSGVTATTVIISNIAGSGNGSTWLVNISQTVASAVAITAVGNSGGQITLIPTGAWTTSTSGNIALASTAVVNKALIMTYDHNTAKWYPSY
jgi:hypothetical protein